MIDHQKLCDQLEKFFQGKIDPRPVYEALGVDTRDFQEREVNHQLLWLQMHTAKMVNEVIREGLRQSAARKGKTA